MSVTCPFPSCYINQTKTREPGGFRVIRKVECLGGPSHCRYLRILEKIK